EPWHSIHVLAEAAGQAVPQASGAVTWAVTAALDGVFGLVLGLLTIPLLSRFLGGDKAAH
ncbi:MAG: hypothetical protein ACPG61_11355, partial [Paracoccaceae bacterium]